MPRVSVGYRMPPAAAAQLDPLPAVTLVHAPRGWGKSSLMASRLSADGGHVGPVHWVTLSDQALTADDVETYLGQMRARAEGSEERPTLVIDNIPDLEPGAAMQLLDAAEAWDGPNLVLISRSSRPLVSLAPIAQDSVLITGKHLRIDAARTVEIASRLGIDITLAEAQRVVDDFAGWPGLVRGALFGRVTGGTGLENYDILTRLSAHVMSDFAAMTSGGFAGLLLPEKVCTWAATELFGENGASVVSRIEALGVLARDGEDHRFAPGIRRIGLRAFREAQPERVRELAARLQLRARREGDVRAELLLALEADDWPTVRQIVYDGWEELARDSPDALHEVATRAPESELVDDPRLITARELLGPDGAPRWMREFMAARVPASPPTAAMGPLPAPGEGNISLLDWRKTLTLLAISRLRAADGLTATIAGHQALRYHPEPSADGKAPWASDAAVAAGLALALTLVGNTSAALEWIVRLDEQRVSGGEKVGPGAAVASVVSVDPGAESQTARVAGRLVRVADDLDRLGQVAVGPPADGADPVDELRALLEVTEDAGLQGGLLLVLTGIALVRGDAAPLLVEVERRAIVARSAVEIPVARVLMHACAADLCLALGHATAARSWLDSAHAGPHSTMLLEPATIRLLLARGDNAEVLRRTEQVSESTAPRYALELWLGRAAAARREGLIYVLSEAVKEAVDLAREHHLVRPFIMLPKDVVGPIMELARPGLGELAVPLMTSHPGVFPAPEDEVRLTARELEVLTDLAKGATVPGIARKYVVAPSTIRTHTSALYRKLGVTTRAAAIERATRLGLL